MKKLIKMLSLAVCVCLVFSLVACGSKPAGQETQNTTETTETTQGALPEDTQDQGPNENQCAGDPTLDTEETDYPTEEDIPETTEEEFIEASSADDAGEVDPLPEEEEDIGDIHIPMDDIID